MDLIYDEEITEYLKMSEFQNSLQFLIEKDSQEAQIIKE